ncbi:MAG: hypothetical protein H7070_05485 [Saprospiraceae bacterium]|nr:hypothetical protein [Pyrinomonadaceae bacterium]
MSIIIISAGTVVFGQTDASMRSSSDRRKSNEHETKTVVEMLTKQRLLKEKKDHEEMLKRGEDALTLSKLLEEAFEKNQDISEPDKQKLAALEKLVTKIRKELGGDDDGEGVDLAAVTESKPSTLKEAFTYLQTTTVKLVDELKKTSRFSISVVAIQSSNTVLKLVRFLRLRQ